MKIGRIIDLSHVLIPGKEEYGLKVKTRFVEDVYSQYKRRPEDHYIITEITFKPHVGTHLEAPYHYIKEGKDVSELSLEKLIGEAVILDFTGKKPGQAITKEDLNNYADKIKEGDIVLIKTGMSKFYRTPRAHDRPYITNEAIKWLISEKKIPCLGVDCSGIEPRGGDYQINHQTLFENNVPLIEFMNNLDQLRKDRVLLFVLPVAIREVEAFPVRVVAIE